MANGNIGRSLFATPVRHSPPCSLIHDPLFLRFRGELLGEIAGHAWSGKYRGQTQKWFALRFTGKESEIDILHPAGGHEPEFVEWRWEELQRLPELVVPFKRAVYERVVAEFAKFA